MWIFNKEPLYTLYRFGYLLKSLSCLFIALQDYKRAEQIAGDVHRVQEGLKKVQRLIKQLQKRDYYKILGVKR